MSQENKPEREGGELQKTPEEKMSSEETVSASDLAEEAPIVPKKQPKKISLSAFILSATALVLAAVMLTSAVLSIGYRKKLAEVRESQFSAGGNASDPFALFRAILGQFSYYDLDDEEMMDAALKAYVHATGDRYAEYYTEEEYALLRQNTAGEFAGIGITIINVEIPVNGNDLKAMKIIGINPDSPAERAGMQVGDFLVAVGVGEEAETVDELGYTMALQKLQGEAGTTMDVTVLRLSEGGEKYDTIPFRQISREKLETLSVTSRVYEKDGEKIGVVAISSFVINTPKQFESAVDRLLADGCNKFVFDVRSNPGGDLQSIMAVLSYFLREGDVILSVTDKSDNETVYRVEPTQYEGTYAECSIDKKDIGKYRNLSFSVLCNENTASAAELFVAAVRDYELAPIVGTTTYGKGSIQSVFSLAQFGYKGALKCTVGLYYPPSGKNYDGVGIEPGVIEPLDDSLAGLNPAEYGDDNDNQLQAAISAIAEA